MAPTFRSSAHRWLPVALVGVAVALGIGATFLAAPPPGFSPNVRAIQVPGVNEQLFGGLLLLLLFAPILALALLKLRGGRGLASARPALTFLVVLLLGAAFVAVARSISYGADGSAFFNGPTHTPGNGTPSSSFNQTRNFTGNGTVPPSPLPLPGWAWLLLVIGALAAGLLAYAWMTRASPATAPDINEARRALRARLDTALAALAPGSSADPRSVVIALYAEFLVRVGPALADLETRTPREIARETVERLGIRADHATALTALFEEARYSTHPFTEARSENARDVFRAAAADLDRARNRA